MHDEMDEMRAESEAMKVIPRVTLKEMLSNPMLKTPLAISVMIMLCQQLSGINAVSTTIANHRLPYTNNGTSCFSYVFYTCFVFSGHVLLYENLWNGRYV